MLPNNENILWTSELIVRLRSWVDDPHLRSLGYGRYGTKASSDIEQTINEIERMRGELAWTARERDSLRVAIKNLAAHLNERENP